jgi:hypothetical protein
LCVFRAPLHHATLAAMNRIGGLKQHREGGED